MAAHVTLVSMRAACAGPVHLQQQAAGSPSRQQQGCLCCSWPACSGSNKAAGPKLRDCSPPLSPRLRPRHQLSLWRDRGGQSPGLLLTGFESACGTASTSEDMLLSRSGVP